MKVYNGLNYSYVMEQVITTCVEKTKENPIQPYHFIVDHPMFLEEAFFKHTQSLFSIEIMTLNSHIKKQLVHSLLFDSAISTIEKVIALYHVLSKNKTIFSNTPIYSIIDQLLPIFEEISLLSFDSISLDTTDLLTKQKLDTCISLYQQWLEQLPTTPCLLDLLLNNITTKNIHYIFITNKIMHPKYIQYLSELDIDNEVTIIMDTNTYHYPYYFKEHKSIDMIHEDPFVDSLYTTLYRDTSTSYTKVHPFYYAVETTPLHEVQAIVLDIYQQVVHTKARFQDFAIYYPDASYLTMIQEVLTSFAIPFNKQVESKEIKEIEACLLLLQYIETKQEDVVIVLLDTLLLKQWNDFKVVNGIKKQWQEYHTIEQESYTTYRLYIDATYGKPLQEATQFDQFASILKAFMQEEVLFSEESTTCLQYLDSIIEKKEKTTLLDFISFIEYTKPSTTIVDTPCIDHVHLFHIQQPYSGILHIPYIYLVGMNESIIPPSYKDEGILLDKQKEVLFGISYLQEQVSTFKNNIFKILSSPSSKVTFSYAMISNSGETLLKSSLLLQLQQTYTMQVVSPTPFYLHPSLSYHLYLEGGHDASLPIDSIITMYKQSKNQPSLLSLPLVNKPLSASQLETYNGCPYKYFHQYTIGLQPFNTYLLQPNEIGTLVHHMIEINSSLFSTQEQAVLTNKEQLPSVIHQQIKEYLETNTFLKRKCSHGINRYFITCVEQDVYTTLCILIDQMKVSLFSLMKTEEKISNTYSSFTIKGFVDRIDTFRNYLKVIDYKSSDKELDLNLAMQGFNMQMLIYMDMLSKNHQLEKGAVLYFNTKRRILKSKDSILDTIDEKDYFALYRMNGYVHPDIIEEIDNQIDGSSNIIKARYVKSKDGYSGNLLDSQAFTILLTKIEEHIQLLYNQMLQGNIQIVPKGSKDPTMHTKVNPCTYCPYRSLCHFDIFYNNNCMVENLDVKSILGGETSE